MSPDLSIIIVNWNTRELLRQCLQSVRDAAGRLSLETVVVDNGSSDGSPAMCRESFPEVRLIENDRNLGFGSANNIGVAASGSDLLLLLNSDTVVLPDALEVMVRRMRENPALGVLGCRLLNADRSHQASCMRFPAIRLLAIQELMLYRLSRRLPRMFLEPPTACALTRCDWVYGAAMLVRREAFVEAGGFDPAIWMYAEEMDLCYRIRAGRWEIAFEPGAQVIHFGEGSWKSNDYSPSYLKMVGLLHFYRKHYSRRTCLVARVLVTAGAALRLLGWSGWTLLHAARSEKRRFGLCQARSHLRFIAHSLGILRKPAVSQATVVPEPLEAVEV